MDEPYYLRSRRHLRTLPDLRLRKNFRSRTGAGVKTRPSHRRKEKAAMRGFSLRPVHPGKAAGGRVLPAGKEKDPKDHRSFFFGDGADQPVWPADVLYCGSF